MQEAGQLFDLLVRRVPGADTAPAAFDDVDANLVGAKYAVVGGEVHRPDGRGGGHHDRPLDRPGQPFRFDDGPAGLGERRGDRRWACVVAEVERDAVREAACVAVEGDDDNGQTAVPHVDELAEALRQPGAQVDGHHRRPTLDLRVPPGHGGDGALVQGEYPVDLGVRVEGIEKAGLAGAGVVEEVAYSRRSQLLDDDLGRVSGEGSSSHLGRLLLQLAG